MFVREKTVNGYTYLYLVESVRENGRTKQRIIRTHAEWQEWMAEKQDKGDVYVAKNRHGPTMKIPLRWVGATMSYQDLLNAGGRHHGS